MPQSPITTLGIAASVSTSAVTGAADPARRELGEEERDAERERGRRAASAQNEVTAVPKRKLPAP